MYIGGWGYRHLYIFVLPVFEPAGYRTRDSFSVGTVWLTLWLKIHNLFGYVYCQLLMVKKYSLYTYTVLYNYMVFYDGFLLCVILRMFNYMTVPVYEFPLFIFNQKNCGVQFSEI